MGADLSMALRGGYHPPGCCGNGMFVMQRLPNGLVGADIIRPPHIPFGYE